MLGEDLIKCVINNSFPTVFHEIFRKSTTILMNTNSYRLITITNVIKIVEKYFKSTVNSLVNTI